MRATLDECLAVAAAQGHALGDALAPRLALLTDPDSTLTASMLRDMQAGQRVEADAIVGDMLRHAQRAGIATPLLQVAYTNLKVYEQTLAS